MNCARMSSKRTHFLLSFSYSQLVSFPILKKKKKKSKPEVFALENFSTHVAHLHRGFYLKIRLIFKYLR